MPVDFSKKIENIKKAYGNNKVNRQKPHPPGGKPLFRLPSFSSLLSSPSSPSSSSSPSSPSSSLSSSSPSSSSTFSNDDDDWWNNYSQEPDYTQETNSKDYYKLPSLIGKCNRSSSNEYPGCQTYSCYDIKNNVHNYGYDCEWKEYFDNNAEAYYYFNEQTGEATWTKPTNLYINGGMKKHRKSKNLRKKTNLKKKTNRRRNS